MIKLSMLVLIFTLPISWSHAQTSEGMTTGAISYEANEEALISGLAPFLGINAGYTDQTSSVDSEGVPASLKLLGSYYLDNQKGVFDLGYGLQNQQFSRASAFERARNAGALEAAARYQADNKWQTGVIMNQLFDSGANYGANQADAQFAGLQVLKEFSLNKGYIARAGARIMTDLNVDDRTVNMMMIDFQMGWNPKSYTKPTVKSATAAPIRTPALVETELDKATRFDVNSAELTSGQEDYLKKLANALAERPGLVQEVQISGHTDATGTDAVNQSLSEKRADVVADILRSEIGTQTNIKTSGLSDLYPVSSNYEDNRRVEIKFIGVSNQQELDEVIKSIE